MESAEPQVDHTPDVVESNDGAAAAADAGQPDRGVAAAPSAGQPDRSVAAGPSAGQPDRGVAAAPSAGQLDRDGLGAAPARRGRPWPWLGVVCGAAAAGLLVGFGVVLRGRSLGSAQATQADSRPTFVIRPSASPIAVSESPQVVPSPSPVTTPPSPVEYVAQPGDTLRSVAQEAYGDATQWPRIYQANRDVIGPDPDALQAGTRLRIP